MPKFNFTILKFTINIAPHIKIYSNLKINHKPQNIYSLTCIISLVNYLNSAMFKTVKNIFNKMK